MENFDAQKISEYKRKFWIEQIARVCVQTGFSTRTKNGRIYDGSDTEGTREICEMMQSSGWKTSLTGKYHQKKI